MIVEWPSQSPDRSSLVGSEKGECSTETQEYRAHQERVMKGLNNNETPAVFKRGILALEKSLINICFVDLFILFFYDLLMQTAESL